MNEIAILDHNWIPFSADNNTFQQFIGIIESFDETNATNWIKWKNSIPNQVVIETSNYFYKIYQTKTNDDMFIRYIRHALAKLYQSYGVYWKIVDINQGDFIYQIEQREKLQVCSPDLLTYNELLLNWKVIADQLEQEMRLSYVTDQINEIDHICQLKLIRDCINKYEDFGIKNGQVFLLDDSDWFLAPIDENGDWSSLYGKPYPIISVIGAESVFEPQHTKFDLSADKIKLLEEYSKPEKQWMIRPIINKQHKEFLEYNFATAKDHHIADNIRLLVTGNANHQIQYAKYEYTPNQLINNTKQLSLFESNN